MHDDVRAVAGRGAGAVMVAAGVTALAGAVLILARVQPRQSSNARTADDRP
jgi:hypothetical protein